MPITFEEIADTLEKELSKMLIEYPDTIKNYDESEIAKLDRKIACFEEAIRYMRKLDSKVDEMFKELVKNVRRRAKE